MPAAAVIPAPIGYIKVVAVKKLVVEFLMGRCENFHSEMDVIFTACHFVGQRLDLLLI